MVRPGLTRTRTLTLTLTRTRTFNQSSPRRPRTSKGSISPGRPLAAGEFSPRIEISITSESEVESPANHQPDADAPIETETKATSAAPLTSVAVEAGGDKVRTDAIFVGVRVRASPNLNPYSCPYPYSYSQP